MTTQKTEKKDPLADEICDACPARAAVMVAGNNFKELTFCSHHYRKNEEKLDEEGWQVIFPF